MGCGLCIRECSNCTKDVCDKCHFDCEMCEDSNPHCEDCIVITEKCIRACGETLDSRYFTCTYCLEDILNDATCQDCKLADVILDTEKNTKKGFDDSMCLNIGVRNHLLLRACFNVLHDHKEQCKYAPGGNGFEQAAKRAKANGMID